MTQNKKKSKATVEERRRENDFEARLKNIFPDITIAFTYSDIKIKGNVSKKIKEEGCFGYHERESILVDGKPIKMAWLPHVKDMSPTYIEMIAERVVEKVAEVVDECGDTDSFSADCRQSV